MVPNPAVLNLRTLLNGKTMQNGYADDMIFSIPEIVSHLSKVCTKVELHHLNFFLIKTGTYPSTWNCHYHGDTMWYRRFAEPASLSTARRPATHQYQSRIGYSDL